MSGVASRAASAPRREDVGDLIVMHLYGSYREMGRQQVELLGPLAREAYELHRADWATLINGFGPVAKLADSILPRFWMTVSRRYDDTGLYDEIAGIAEALGVSPAAGWRGVFGTLGGATTTFVATRSATADGTAVMGKNSDWPDRYGRRPPLLMHYNPTNGDLAHVVATWPLCPLGATVMNESGFTMGINFFNADQVLALGLPRWPGRRAIQKATTVDEGVRIIESSPNRGMSGFASMADASGSIALMECTPGDSERVNLDGDWFAQSNHARTEKMVQHDRGRSLDSEMRFNAMHAAVVSRAGQVTPENAVEIMRDRSNSPYLNDSTIANTSVFHSVIAHPASKTLWHSIQRQPLAPFGGLAAFSPGAHISGARPIPAHSGRGTPEMEDELALIQEMRRAVRLFDEGQVEQAGLIWDGLAAQGDPLAHPHRLTWARARARWTLGRLEEADRLLADLDEDEVPFDVRINAVVARAVVADRLGRRDEAVRLYERGRELFGANSQYNDGLVSFLRRRIARGLKAPQVSGPFPGTPALQRVPG